METSIDFCGTKKLEMRGECAALSCSQLQLECDSHLG